MIAAPVIFLTNRRTKLLDSKPLHGHIDSGRNAQYGLARSFDNYQLSHVTKRHMPAAMFFLDLERLGVPPSPQKLVRPNRLRSNTRYLSYGKTGIWYMTPVQISQNWSPMATSLALWGPLTTCCATYFISREAPYTAA
jgi:hypothetical protein